MIVAVGPVTSDLAVRGPTRTGETLEACFGSLGYLFLPPPEPALLSTDATQLHGCGEVLGDTGRIALGTVPERYDLLSLPTTTAGGAGQREGSAHELHKSTTGQRIGEPVRLLGKFSVDELVQFRTVFELLKAAPKSVAGWV